jgi:hypothetical protein
MEVYTTKAFLLDCQTDVVQITRNLLLHEMVFYAATQT